MQSVNTGTSSVWPPSPPQTQVPSSVDTVALPPIFCHLQQKDMLHWGLGPGVWVHSWWIIARKAEKLSHVSRANTLGNKIWLTLAFKAARFFGII